MVDPKVRGQLAEEQREDEDIVLQYPGEEAHHLRQELAGLLGGQRRKVDALLHPIDVSQLVGVEAAAAQLCVAVRRQRISFNRIGDEDERCLRQGVKVV